MIWDIAAEAIAAVLARPARAFLVSAGTLVGVATLVATLGLATTARAQIGSQFNAYSATEVTVTVGRSARAALASQAAVSSARRINGVVAAGRLWQIPNSVGWRKTWDSRSTVPANLYAADPTALSVIKPHLIVGRVVSKWDEWHLVPSVMLSSSLAAQLGIRSVYPENYVFLGQRGFLVVGIFNNVAREPETLLAAVIDSSTGVGWYGRSSGSELKLIVSTLPGSAQVVADQLPVALWPRDPSAVTATSAESSTLLRNSISADIQKLLLVLAIVAMLVGTLGIANGTLVSVIERVPEIGLRRALGARRRDIAGQFLIEGAVTGMVGGVLGLAAGILIVVALSAANSWTPTIDLSLVALAPLAGAATGLLAAGYPAWRGASIPAVEALHR